MAEAFRQHLVTTEGVPVQRHLDRFRNVRYAKTGIRSAQRAGQRIEIVRLPARHDVDVEGRPHRAVCDRRQSTDQHVGHAVPIQETEQ